ncbi:DUF58 domain-containing protein [Persephonella hydrogeniphila]|nr:DUF58 domain-containing protein [Persephonella hydrogeniphila]
MLSFMGISGFFGKRNLSNLDLEIDMPEEIFAGVEFPVRVVLKNKKRFLPSFLVIFHFYDKKYIVPYIDPKGSYTFHINYLYRKRGKYTTDSFGICSVFPFNFFVRCIVYQKKIPVIVYPYPRKMENLYNSSGPGRRDGHYSTQKSGSQGDIVSIRNYSPGDPVKFIHWKASARTGELKVKEMEDLSSKPVIIDLDSIHGDLETKVSYATYLVLELYKNSVPFGLKYGKKFFKPEHSRKQKAMILTELAVLR